MINADATSSGMADAQMISIIIVGVLGFSAFIGWMAWRFLKSFDDPRRVRRRLILLGTLYIFAAINVILEVVKGKAPLLSLLGLPIAVLFAWFYLRTANKIQIPPK